MAKLVFALLLAGVGLLQPTSSAPLATLIDVRPASGESVTIRVAGGEGILFKASMASLKRDGMRLMELTAPGTLEITGGDGAMQLSSADGISSFVLSVRSEVRGRTRVLEARGEHATIRVLGGEVEIEAASMSMRESRAP